MKLIVQDVIKIDKKWLEEDYQNILAEFTVFFKEDEESIYIEEQKITLDEIDMNTLFFEIILNFAEIKYAYHGGRGCGLTLSLNKKKD